MKIASFSINNVNRRLTNLLNWLREAEPDIACLQEIKAADGEFPMEAIPQAGYHASWRGEGRWNDPAIMRDGARANSRPAWGATWPRWRRLTARKGMSREPSRLRLKDKIAALREQMAAFKNLAPVLRATPDERGCHIN